MANCPKFLISENPMVDDTEYVYHTQKPRFLAKRVYGNPVTDFEIVDEIDSFSDYGVEKIAGIMRRLGDWYVSYCNWLEEQKFEDED